MKADKKPDNKISGAVYPPRKPLRRKNFKCRRIKISAKKALKNQSFQRVEKVLWDFFEFKVRQ